MIAVPAFAGKQNSAYRLARVYAFGFQLVLSTEEADCVEDLRSPGNCEASLVTIAGTA